MRVGGPGVEENSPAFDPNEQAKIWPGLGADALIAGSAG